jgi:hypothetical protein
MREQLPDAYAGVLRDGARNETVRLLTGSR